MKIYDTHLHTHHSHDGRFSCSEIAYEAVKRKLSGICITDHYDSALCKGNKDFLHIKKSLEETRLCAKDFEGKLEIYAGVELGDYLFGKKQAQEFQKNMEFDFILCSMHASVIGKQIIPGFNNVKFFSELKGEENNLFLKMYFKCTLDTIRDKSIDFDSLAHLTYPLRYIVAINKNTVDIESYYPVIKGILGVLIEKNKALEINTSCLATDWKYTLPNYEIIKMYYDLGGRLITIGSDAHFTERIGLGIESTLGSLKEIGFVNYYIYKERKPIAISLC